MENRPLALVPGIRTGGGTAFAGDAIELVSDQLEITNPRRPRFLYVLSDGGWADTRAGVERIRWLAEHDVPTIHLGIAIEPLGVECDRIHVITDPAQALDQITIKLHDPANRRRDVPLNIRVKMDIPGQVVKTTYLDVQPLVTAHCIKCHSPAGGLPPDNGLDLSVFPFTLAGVDQAESVVAVWL